MIEKVKEVLLRQCDDELINLQQKLKEKKSEIDSPENNKKNKLLQMPNVSRDKFNWLQKHITRRSEYQEYKKKQQMLIEVDVIELKITELKLKRQAEIESLEQRIEAVEKRKDIIKSAKVIRDLNLDISSVMKLLVDNDIPLVLTEEDKVVTQNERDYTSLSSLMAVHKTAYAPISSVIKTSKDARVMDSETITINGKEYEYERLFERDTIHTAINNEVAEHTNGTAWNSMKYAILIPFSDIPKQDVIQAASVDTFCKGSLRLTSNSWILCPVAEVEKIKQDNPGVNVIGYEGEKALGYPRSFLSALGYRAEEMDNYSWNDSQSQAEYEELMKSNSYGTALHNSSFTKEDENMLSDLNRLIAICGVIRDNQLLNDHNNIPDIEKLLKSGIESLLSRGGYQYNHSSAMVANYRTLDVFISRFEENGFKVSDTYKDILERINRFRNTTIEHQDVLTTELDMQRWDKKIKATERFCKIIKR